MVSRINTTDLFVRQTDYHALAERRLDLSNVVLGGDVLILGATGSGKTTLAQALASLCVSFLPRKACILDFIPDQESGTYSSWLTHNLAGGARILSWRDGKVVLGGYPGAHNTVWNYAGQAIPTLEVDLARSRGCFDDLIVDSWPEVAYPSMEDNASRKIVLSQVVTADLAAHKWAHVFALRMTSPDDIAYISGYANQFVSTAMLDRGAALLLSPGHVGEIIRVVR